MAADQQNPEQAWREKVQFKNEVWRDYRIRGQAPFRRPEEELEINQRLRANPPQPPNPNAPLLFFENYNWNPEPYANYLNNAHLIARSTDLDPRRSGRELASSQKRYRELLEHFDKPRHVAQGVLGYGGNGMAAHFKDHGPDGTNQPGRDFVVKASQVGWQSNVLTREKMMMRKVADSAHCVQLIDPQEVGKPEEGGVSLPLDSDDSSIDGDSSGNESLNYSEIRKRYRVQKRDKHPRRYHAARQRRWLERKAEIEAERAAQAASGQRKDYILMEYVQHGSLATLIHKIQRAQNEDEEPIVITIPNRVLWSFWLCLIRACIAMEYPPRKFHPNRVRKRPEVDFLRAKANRMVRECMALAINVLGKGNEDQTNAPNRLGRADLIENLPTAGRGTRLRARKNWNLERRQNMVHHDIDPNNVFVNGLELNDEGLEAWQQVRQKAQERSQNPEASVKMPQYTDKQPGRCPGEHGLVPRLKLADFGAAHCVKQQKRNVYYHAQRGLGKFGDYAPEDFGPEWERIPGDRDGSQLADSRTCGFYSHKTNIWGIALTMWQVITGFEPPVPPNPQPPYDEIESYPAYNEYGQTNIDMALNDPRYKEFKVSYCPLLMDPRVSDYDWVDESLRKRIFECMYHKPDDRPSLEELLTEAEEKLQADFPGESDADIREWIQNWFFDSPDAPKLSPARKTQGSDDNVNPNVLAQQIANDDDANPHRMQLLVQMNADFPDGWLRIENREPELRCGLRAVVDSFEHQLGERPVIDGVEYDLSGRLPSIDDLLAIHASLEDRLEPVGLSAVENMNVTVLGLIVHEWGIHNGLDLELGYVLEGRRLPFSTTNHHENPVYIWIYNNNARDLAQMSQGSRVPRYNHYEGIGHYVDDDEEAEEEEVEEAEGEEGDAANDSEDSLLAALFGPEVETEEEAEMEVADGDGSKESLDSLFGPEGGNEEEEEIEVADGNDGGDRFDSLFGPEGGNEEEEEMEVADSNDSGDGFDSLFGPEGGNEEESEMEVAGGDGSEDSIDSLFGPEVGNDEAEMEVTNGDGSRDSLASLFGREVENEETEMEGAGGADNGDSFDSLFGPEGGNEEEAEMEVAGGDDSGDSLDSLFGPEGGNEVDPFQ